MKTDLMKLVPLLVLAALSLFSPFGCSCGGGIAATGWGTIEAIVDQDVERVTGYFIEEIREEVTFAMEVVFAIVDEIDISNVEYQILSETEDTASVEVEADWWVEAAGYTRSGYAKERIDLEKVEREWLIIDFAPFQWLVDEITSFEFEE